MFVKLERAVEVVLDLARENIISEGDADDNDLVQARAEAIASVDTVEDFFTNYWIKEDESTSLADDFIEVVQLMKSDR